MKGLVLKDLMVLKSTMKTVVVILVAFGVMGSMGGNSFLTTFASVYAAILPMTCMAYDERSNFNRFAMTMPVKVSDIVLSKYVTGLVLAVMAMAFGVVVMVVTGGNEFAEIIAASIVIPVFYHSIMMPLLFTFGTEKSRVITMVIFVIPALLVGFVADSAGADRLLVTLAGMDTTMLTVCATAVLVAAYIASIFISIAICRKKEW